MLISNQENYYEEYKLYDVAELATTIATPLIKNYLKNWQPLVNPEEPIELIKEWKNILESDHGSVMSSLSNQDPFGKLVWHAWIPSIRFAIT